MYIHVYMKLTSRVFVCRNGLIVAGDHKGNILLYSSAAFLKGEPIIAVKFY